MLMRMEFRLLGPVAVLHSGRAVEIRSMKVVELLAVLLLSPGYRASHFFVARNLWPGDEPNSNRIRQCVHQLKQVVPEIVQGGGRGYCQIQIDPQHVDLDRFREAVVAAKAAEKITDRLAALRLALREWRGTPLQDLPGKGFEELRAALMTEVHDAVVACVRAEMECAENAEALARINAALKSWPDSERLIRHKVRALRALGRHHEVEQVLTSWEHTTGRSAAPLLLADETEHQDGLGTVTNPTFRRLPANPAELVGREPECERLMQILLGQSASRRLAVITGMPGIGKTALATHTADLCETSFPDGVLSVDLGGFSARGPEPPGHVLARLLNDLGIRPKTSTLDGMVSAFRTGLERRAVLLVLDNARDEDHVRQLLPGPGGSAAIITSRHTMDGLLIKHGAERIELAPLNQQDATAMLRTRLEEDRQRVVVPFFDDLVKHCGGLPLALIIMAGRIARRPAQAIAGVIRELRRESTRLASLDLGSMELSVRLSLESSCKLLSEPASRLFWQLGLHPGPTISWTAILALAPPNVALRAIDELLRMSLVSEPSAERYSLHDLVRVFASELADHQTDIEQAETVDQVVTFLLHSAWACDQKLDPGRKLPIGAQGGAEVESPNNAGQAMSWFEAEYLTLTEVIKLAVKRGLHRDTWLLSMTLVTFQWRSGRYLEALEYLTVGLEAAERVADPSDVAMVHRMLAGTQRSLGNHAPAARELRRAVQISEECGDTPGAAMGRHILGVILRESGEVTEALENFSIALTAFTDLGAIINQGAALNGIGSAQYDLGRHEESVRTCLQSLTLLDSTDDINGQAHVRFSLGRARLALREHDAAIADFKQALGLYRSLNYTSREARVLVWLADALCSVGHMRESDDAMTQVRDILRDLGENDIEMEIERLRGLP
ncbi:BTAD domain-containing putative transcriptional regulator [Streptosporangium oxazolinicum]|uniref:BTAD domain-containing putative transcriptional regulator n=2 Tax=Streptosporangium oxazolinicum TaxID=909287 RepID=A0ABP8BMM2_9ACTN